MSDDQMGEIANATDLTRAKVMAMEKQIDGLVGGQEKLLAGQEKILVSLASVNTNLKWIILIGGGAVAVRGYLIRETHRLDKAIQALTQAVERLAG